ncbi:MAG: hypothetical protein KKH41_08555 [Candidatus Thermoplasmatota archaeon]|nr:hypothetical protein [Candidatus Thermoplasmatota archaeon]
MAKKEDEAPKESTEDAQSLVSTSFRTDHMGVWGNTVSSLAPVTGMITTGILRVSETSESGDE